MSDLRLLAGWMAGEFSNGRQALAQPQQFAHIRVRFRPLPFEFFAGVGLYSEQVYDYDLWAPYRQGVHRLVDRGAAVYIENYALSQAWRYAGAGRDLGILGSIPRQGLVRRWGCSMVFRREGERFRGAVEPGRGCLIEKLGCQTYLESEVVVTEQTWVSLDRGLELGSGRQVWGSDAGPLRFEKQVCFAHEVPGRG